MSATSDEDEIRGLIERWAAAAHDGDLGAVLADHTADIVMFDVPPPYQGVRGLDDYRDTWPGFFAWQASGATFAIESLQIEAGADVAFAFGLLRCGTAADFEHAPEQRLRLTVGLRKTEGRWTVAHEHHSFADSSGPQDESAAAGVTTWDAFTEAAPKIATVFLRRHAATGNLCFLGTVRADGSPRISPIEPRVFEGRLWLVGMPNTRKFADLERDPRFCLHTATVDTHVADGDAKLWGVVDDVPDAALHQRFATALFDETGFDLRGQTFDHFYAADLTSASSLEIVDGHLEVTIWKPGEPERVVRKH